MSYLPSHVEYLYECERHGDKAEHQVGNGKVHDEDVPCSPHGRITDNHQDNLFMNNRFPVQIRLKCFDFLDFRYQKVPRGSE